MASRAYGKSDAHSKGAEVGHIHAEESDGFAERLAGLVGDEAQTAFAKRCGFSESTLRGYLGGADPSRKRLLAIADATGVNVEWLATGKGPKERHRVPLKGVDFSDVERLSLTIETVEQALRATTLTTLSASQYATLVGAAYELIGGGTHDADAIARVSRLIQATARLQR